MTNPSQSVEIFCVKCKARTGSRDIEAVTMKNGRRCHPRRLRGLRHQEVPHRRPALTGSLIPAAWRLTSASPPISCCPHWTAWPRTSSAAAGA